MHAALTSLLIPPWISMVGSTHFLWVRKGQNVEDWERRTKLDLLHSASACTCRQIPAINLSADVGVSKGTDGSFRTYRRGKRLLLCTWRTDLVTFCGFSVSAISFDPFPRFVGLGADAHNRSPPTTFRLFDDTEMF